MWPTVLLRQGSANPGRKPRPEPPRREAAGREQAPPPFNSPALRPNREKMTQRLEPEGRLQGLLVDTVQMTS